MLFDIRDNFDKLFKLYDSKIELSGVLVFTSLLCGVLLIVLVDNREVTIDNNIYYKQFFPKTWRDGVIGFAVLYLLALYVYSKKKTNPIPQGDKICLDCNIPMDIQSWKCKRCGKSFG